MRTYVHKLSNGIRILTVPMPSLESATLTVWVRTGSRNESEKMHGLSHFLEHMAFKGSVKRPTAKEVAVAMDSIGAENNAGTSKEWTNYYIKARADKMPLAMDILSDLLINPILDSAEIEKEKGVICEEISMYEDTPMIDIPEFFEEALYGNTSLGRNISGTKKEVRSLTRNDFLLYRKDYYDADNIIITVAGNVKDTEVFSLAEKYFGAIKKGLKKIKTDEEDFTAGRNTPVVKLKNKKTDQTHIMLGFYSGIRGTKDRYKEAVLSAILGRGMSSRLFSEVREKRGLAYAVSSNIERYIDTGYLSAYMGVVTNRADEAVEVALDQFYGISSSDVKISPEELSKAKEYLKGHTALSLEDTKNVNYFFGEDFLFGFTPETPEEIYKQVDAVSAQEIVELAKKLFVPKYLSIAIIGPYTDTKKFDRIAVSK